MTNISLTNEKQVKNNFLTVLTFVCSIMIVGLHAYNAGDLPQYASSAIIQSVFSHGWFTGAVPIFFFTSGYLFYKNVNSVNDCFLKQKKRVISVLMPFVAWSVFYYVVYTTGGRVLGASMDVGASPIEIISGVLFYKYSFHLWYMFQLFLFVIVSPLLHFVLSNKKLSVFILMIATVLGMLGLGSINIQVFDMERTLFHMNYFAYYFAGCFIAKVPNVLRKLEDYIKKAPLFALIILYMFFGTFSGFIYGEYIKTFNNRCMVPLVALSLWALLFKIYTLKSDIKAPNRISTMVIYGIHPIVGMVVRTVFGFLSLPSLVHYVLWFVLTVLLSCFAAFLMRYLKPIHWVFSGNR